MVVFKTGLQCFACFLSCFELPFWLVGFTEVMAAERRRMVTFCALDVMMSGVRDHWVAVIHISAGLQPVVCAHRLQEFLCGVPMIRTGRVQGQIMHRRIFPDLLD